jgi:hypothetical protein
MPLPDFASLHPGYKSAAQTAAEFVEQPIDQERDDDADHECGDHGLQVQRRRPPQHAARPQHGEDNSGEDTIGARGDGEASCGWVSVCQFPSSYAGLTRVSMPRFHVGNLSVTSGRRVFSMGHRVKPGGDDVVLPEPVQPRRSLVQNLPLLARRKIRRRLAHDADQRRIIGP